MEQYIEHTLLKPEATEGTLRKLVEEAEKHRFFGVCVLPKWVAKVKGWAPLKVVSVVAFPHGMELERTKREQARVLVEEGVDEIDMVASIGDMKEGNWAAVVEDIEGVVGVAGGRPVKVIIETALLTDEEIRRAARCVEQGGAQFVKTSTGAAGGATVEGVKMIKGELGDRLGIKASGGIRSYDQALALLKAGATRIGTSAGVAILKEIL